MNARSMAAPSAETAAPVVSILILSERLEAFEACAASIAATVDPRSVAYEIVTLFQGIHPDALDAYEKRESRVRGIRVRMQIGVGPGLNIAARRARGKYVVFLHEDSRVSPGWLSHLLETAEENPGIGIVGSRVTGSDGTLKEAGVTVYSDGTVGPSLGYDRADAGSRSVRDVDCVAMDGLLVRADSFSAIGGFDERYRPGGFEDRDLCFAVRNVLHQRVVCDDRSTIARTAAGDVIDGDLESFLRDRLRAVFCEKWKDALVVAPPPNRNEPAPTPPPPLRIVERPARPSVKIERRVIETRPSDDLHRARAQAETAEIMLAATDAHVAALERRMIELNRIVLTLQGRIDDLHVRIAEATSGTD
jgi:glycosyltransferase involved in cell wall biosynthesis